MKQPPSSVQGVSRFLRKRLSSAAFAAAATGKRTLAEMSRQYLHGTPVEQLKTVPLGSHSSDGPQPVPEWMKSLSIKCRDTIVASFVAAYPSIEGGAAFARGVISKRGSMLRQENKDPDRSVCALCSSSCLALCLAL